jgi:prepilin-type N-terminal cleavage/methylation domain-containing protein
MNPSVSHHRLRPQAATIRGFSLVELMVTMVIVAILAALALAGLAGVRQRAKIDKTRSTIRKLNEIILPHYESYIGRRVLLSGTFPGAIWYSGSASFGDSSSIPSASGARRAAVNRLWGLRLAMTLEMPDQWSDVAPLTKIPKWAVTAPVRRYASFQTSVSGSNRDRYQSAECLAMIVTRGGFNPNAIETFRADEIGDIDRDGAPEFHDGWGRPIAFTRWPAGFASPWQVRDVTANPDPFDPLLVSSGTAFSPDAQPPNSPQTDYGVIPLIFSPGPDEADIDPSQSGASFYGGLVGTADVQPVLTGSSWVATLAGPVLPVPSMRKVLKVNDVDATPGSQADGSASDNVTNHDLLKK